MGVQGLWSILDSTGHPIKLEALEGRVLGVDATIWLYQFLRGFRDRDDAAKLDGHKIGLFRRISKLLFYKIRPVFVFDGPAPQLKRRTLERRQERRNKSLVKAQGTALKILAEQIKTQYPNADVDRLMKNISVPNLTSHHLVATNKLGDEDLEMFQFEDTNDIECDDDIDYQPFTTGHSNSGTTFAGAQDLSKIDLDSEDFKNLPAEVRYEILTDIKNKNRRHRHDKYLPEDSDSFSNFQLERLRVKRSVQEKIEEAERDICSSVPDNEFNCDLLDNKRSIVESYRIHSDPTLRMLYLKNLSDQSTSIKHNITLESGVTRSNNLKDIEEEVKEEKVDLTPIKASLKDYLSSAEKPDFKIIGRKIARTASKLPTSHSKSPNISDDEMSSLSPPSISSQQQSPRQPTVEEPEELKRKVNSTESPDDSMNETIVNESSEVLVLWETPHTVSRGEAETQSAPQKTFGLPNAATTSLSSNPTRDQSSRKLPVEDHEKSERKSYEESQAGAMNDTIMNESAEVLLLWETPRVIADEAAGAQCAISKTSDTPIVATSSQSSTSSKQESSRQPTIDANREGSPANSMTETINGDSDEELEIWETPHRVVVGEDEARSSTLNTNDASNSVTSSQPSTSSQQLPLKQLTLEALRGKTDREVQDARSMADKIVHENKELLELWETPHRVATGEAEPQSSTLDTNETSNGATSSQSSAPAQQQPSRQLTSEELEELKRKVNREERHANSMTDKIIRESKELLELWGIPYIVAAGEAEAQCATLETLKLTEGTITDDSDVWLFGARVVYKNFFSDHKYAMQFKMTDIEHHIRLDREALICMAMLVGSDYTDGIEMVGPVTALEILSEFPGKELDPLIKFRDWWKNYKESKDKIPGNKKRERFVKLDLPEEFPSRLVFDGYMQPCADDSDDKFTWGMPKLDELREYARQNFGWDTKKIDENLLPVMKKVNDKSAQPKIDMFFFRTEANKNPSMFRSKRVNQALETFSGGVGSQPATNEQQKKKTSSGRGRGRGKATASQRGARGGRGKQAVTKVRSVSDKGKSYLSEDDSSSTDDDILSVEVVQNNQISKGANPTQSDILNEDSNSRTSQASSATSSQSLVLKQAPTTTRNRGRGSTRTGAKKRGAFSRVVS